MNDDLVRKAREGDGDAFGTLVKPLQRQLELFVSGQLSARMKPKVSARDVVQDAFLKAFQDLMNSDVTDYPSFTRWLHKVVWHQLLNTCRFYKRQIRSIDLEAGQDQPKNIPATDPRPSDGLKHTERKTTLQDALDQLNDDQFVVVCMHYFEHKSVTQIAQTLSLLNNTVSARLMRARQNLRSILQSGEGNK